MEELLSNLSQKLSSVSSRLLLSDRLVFEHEYLTTFLNVQVLIMLLELSFHL